MPSPDTDTAQDLLTWAAGTGSAPTALRERVKAALTGVDLDECSPIDVDSIMLRRALNHVREHIPEVNTLREALSDPQRFTRQGLAEQIKAAAEHAIAELPIADILAEARQEAQEHQRQMNAILAAEQRRHKIEAAAEHVRDRSDEAATFDRGTRMAAGALAAAVKAAADRSPVDLAELSLLTGYPQTSLHKFAEEATRPTTRDPATATNGRLAELHLGYGPGGDEHVDREFWHRFPHLRGWYHAALWVHTTHSNAWWDAKGGFDPCSDEEPPDLPAYEQMMRQYRDMVRAIAAGLTPQDDVQDA